MPGLFDTHVAGTASAVCRGAGGRFERRTTDVDFVMPGLATEAEAKLEAANTAIQQFGEGCRQYRWLNFTIDVIPAGSISDTFAVVALVSFECPKIDGKSKETYRTYAENVPVGTDREQLDRIITGWANAIIEASERGFGLSPGEMLGCKVKVIAYQSIFPWEMSGGIGE